MNPRAWLSRLRPRPIDLRAWLAERRPHASDARALARVGLALAGAAVAASGWLLLAQREIFASDLGNLFVPEDVPLFEAMDRNTVAVMLLHGGIGGVLALGALALGVTRWRAGRRGHGPARSARPAFLLCAALLAAAATGFALRASPPELRDRCWQWTHGLALPAVALGLFALLVHRAVRESGVVPAAIERVPGRVRSRALVLAALVIALSMALALPQHWQGYHAAEKWLLDEQDRADARLLIAGMTAFYAVLMSLVSLAFFGAYRLLDARAARRGRPAGSPATVCAFSLLFGLAFALAHVGLPLAGAKVDIINQRFWSSVAPAVLLPAGLVAVLHVLAIEALAEEYQRRRLRAPLTELAAVAAALFPVYPLLGPLLRAVPTRAFRPTMLVLSSAAVWGAVTAWARLNVTIDKDWKAVFTNLEQAATVFQHLLGVFLLYAFLRLFPWRTRRPWRWVPVRAGAAALVLLGAATAATPFFVLPGARENAKARLIEFNPRYRFEFDVANRLLDCDFDRYSALLAADPDDFDPARLPLEVNLTAPVDGPPKDEFTIVDPDRARAFPPLVILTLEGIRPDYLAAYGDAKSVSPHLAALARRAVRFNRVWALYPATWEGWVQMMGGHPVRVTEYTVAKRTIYGKYVHFNGPLRIAEQLGFERFCLPVNSGYRALLVDETAIRNDFDRTIHEDGRALGDVFNERLLKFIPTLASDERFLLVEHLLDAHFPYRHREGFGFGTEFVDRYRSEVAWMDRQIGEIFDALRAQGRFDESLIVVIGDHGNEFWEHDEYYYTTKVYDESMRIPLIIKMPFATEADERVVDEPACQLDLLPTLLDLAGMAPARALPGVSLAPYLEGREPTPAALDRQRRRDLLMTSHQDKFAILRDFRYKLIWYRGFNTWKLFDLQEDPGEKVNLADSRPELRAELTAGLRALMYRYPWVVAGMK